MYLMETCLDQVNLEVTGKPLLWQDGANLGAQLTALELI